jgi:hypothetical protein
MRTIFEKATGRHKIGYVVTTGAATATACTIDAPTELSIEGGDGG